ncbi:hypothetical protein FF1_009526 [Malus domestica]
MGAHLCQRFGKDTMALQMGYHIYTSSNQAESEQGSDDWVLVTVVATIGFLLVMQKHGYMGEFEYDDDHRARKIVVKLNGRLNRGVIACTKERDLKCM